MRTEVAAVDATGGTLAHLELGAPDRPGRRVVLVHGFAQTSQCLGPLAPALGERHTVFSVDAPGHGGSFRHAAADMARGAELLSATAGPGVYVGYSMGGRLCLRAAVQHPDAVQALVVIGATAGIDDDRARAERAEWDEQHAARLERIGLDAFVDEWLEQPLFAGLPSWARFDSERRANTVEGLAASLRHAGTGSMEPLWDRLEGIGCPVLVVTGGRDERYGELGERLVGAIGANAAHVVVPGAGHSAHLERPSETSAAILEFLDR